MTIHSRKQWGAREPKYTNRGNLNKASTGHWNGPTVTINGKTTWDHSKCASLVRGIQNFHMDVRKWADIAYNFVVCPHGDIYVGRGINVRNGANGTNSGNASSHAVMWLSGERNPFTNEERIGFVDCVRYISNLSSAPNSSIGHRDHKATLCPGDVRYNWIRQGMVTGNSPITPVHPPSPGKGNPILRRGSTGPEVYVLQAIIKNKAGGNISVDGDFGSQTEARVKDLQRFFGLKPDGIVGEKTWGVLIYLNSL